MVADDDICEECCMAKKGKGKKSPAADYEPMLMDFPDTWPERWQAIRRFIERWHEVSLPEIGGQAQRIREVETNLGYALPGSFHEWIALIYDLIDTGGYGLVFRDALSFDEIKGNEAVSLLIQGEGDYHWAVKKQYLDSADPPVDGFCLDYEHGESEFIEDKRWADEVSSWALRFVLSYLNISPRGGGFGTKIPDPAELRDVLSKSCQGHLHLGMDEIFEARNLIAVISHNWFGGDPYLNVYVWKPIPMREIPPVLMNYTKSGGWFQGIFAPRSGTKGATIKGG
jgi:hypothetical protein